MKNDVYLSDSEFLEVVYRLKNGVPGKLISGYGPGWKSVAVHYPGPGPVAVKLPYEKFERFPEVVKAVRTAVVMDSLQFSILQLLWKRPESRARDQFVSAYIQLHLGIQEFQLLAAAFNQQPSQEASSQLGVWEGRVAPLAKHATDLVDGRVQENQVQISWGTKAQQQVNDAVRLLRL